MTIQDDFKSPEELVEDKILRMNAIAIAVGFGVLCGVGLFVATLILVAKGGAWTGEHLGLLGQYFPGYRVSVGGSFLGLVYGFVTGGISMPS